MARVLPWFFVVILASLGLWWLLGSGEDGDGTPPLDTGAESIRTALEPASQEPTAKPAASAAVEYSSAAPREAAVPVAKPAPVAVPASAPRERTEGENSLARWHRKLEPQRQNLTGFASDVARGISDFLGLAGRESAAARERMRQQPAKALGPAFVRLSDAYVRGGLAGLEAALRTQPPNEPATLAWSEFLGHRAVYEQEFARGARALGQSVRAMIQLGYPRERVLELKTTIDTLGNRANEFLQYAEYEVVSGDSLRKICQDFRKQGAPVWFGWIRLFNRRGDSNTIRVGQKLKIPTTPLVIDVWRDARLLVISAAGMPIRLYSISVGKEGHESPIGNFQIAMHESEPVWWPDEGQPVPFGNPDNPLGTRWLGFAEQTQYGIHGNNSEETIGSFESLGCIRMHNTDVEEVYELVPNGTTVTIRP